MAKKKKAKISREAREATKRAIAVIGSINKTAAEFKITRQAVSHWQKNGVPVLLVVTVEKRTGVPRAELRPDIFGAA